MVLSHPPVVREALTYLEGLYARGQKLESPKDAGHLFCLRMGLYQREVFAVAHLDNRHRLIAIEEISLGTIDGATVHPREVVKAALEHNSAALILAHNHPSGDPSPSESDRQITRRLKEALTLIDVRVLDHLIVGGAECVSLAETGRL